MALIVKVYLRRASGGVEEFPDVDSARAAAVPGDVIGKGHRGGHVEYEIAVEDGFVVQADGWRPGRPIYRGD
ncbi:MAG TPA: hypothetical protein VEC15_11045 [Actinomycetota bacterium]|nr:hypothetical protein [Actinomycetota bacterium]